MEIHDQRGGFSQLLHGGLERLHKRGGRAFGERGFGRERRCADEAARIPDFASEGARPIEGLQWYHYLIFVLIGYVVAITQVVPGLSATAILMAFGYFSSIMNSVHLSYWKQNPMILLV